MNVIGAWGTGSEIRVADRATTQMGNIQRSTFNSQHSSDRRSTNGFKASNSNAFKPFQMISNEFKSLFFKIIFATNEHRWGQEGFRVKGARPDGPSGNRQFARELR